MVLGLSKNGYKKQVSMKERKPSQKHELCTKGKFIIRRKEGFMNVRIKKKLVLWISGSKRESFPMQEVGRKMIFP